MTNYHGYAFSDALKTHSWYSFLDEYFKFTLRQTRLKEDRSRGIRSPDLQKRIDYANKTIFPNLAGAGLALTDESLTKANPAESGSKPNPADSGGGTYLSPSIKNHPKEISLSERASKAIKINGR